MAHEIKKRIILILLLRNSIYNLHMRKIRCHTFSSKVAVNNLVINDIFFFKFSQVYFIFGHVSISPVLSPNPWWHTLNNGRKQPV